MLFEREKRKPERKRNSVCPYKVREWKKDTEDRERKRWGMEGGVEKWNIELKWRRRRRESEARRVKDVALDGWVKAALVPIKSHYCRLITQESCSLYRYEQGLWYMNNSGSGKDTGIHRYGGVRMSLSVGLGRHRTGDESTS